MTTIMREAAPSINGRTYSIVNVLKVVVVDKSHITVRCLLRDSSVNTQRQSKITYCSDILQECVKWILIL